MRQAGGMWSAYFILGNTFVPRSGVGRGALATQLGTNAWTKNDEKGYFLSRWAVRSHVIVKDQKNSILVGKGRFSQIWLKKNAVIRGKIQTENTVERVPVFLYFEHTV